MEGARVTAASAGERLPGLQSIIFHGNQPINKPKNSNLFGKQDSAQPPCCLFWLGNLPNIPGAVRSLPIKPKAAHAVRCYSRACGYRFSLCFQVLRRQQAASSPGKPTP
ncbi:hypothetical protein Y1Q_0008134 [Alligator mississippiensis]|uniref:Uncharacterized protein n=1 Tax=Alligator mississippiensis TaxID=8496 RepID=A0A151N6J6_ALLMI|nr:hypothetical protein Y1Q_0008134 [Alligator mississippiensis]